MRAGTPAEEYRGRLESHRASLRELGAVERRLSYLRLTVFAIGAALVWPALFSRTLAWPWLLIPIVGFGFLLVLHERVARRQSREYTPQLHTNENNARQDNNQGGKGSC